MRWIVSAVSLAACLVAGWMTVMYFVLRHPGYLWRAAIASAVCAGAATLVRGTPPAALRIPIALWGAALAALGVLALVSLSDDGWVLVAGALFGLEGGLAIVAAVVPERRVTP